MKPERSGDWLQTFTGRCFWPLDPRADEVCIEDIAHSLSMRCRYGGHSTSFYSVAEHSVLVSHQVPAADALWALLHDAAEAYSADVPRPLKRCLPDWKPMEARIMQAVCNHFGLPEDEPASVKHADLAITADERAVLMAPCERDWGALPPPLGVVITGLPPAAAKAMFLARFAELQLPALSAAARAEGLQDAARWHEKQAAELEELRGIGCTAMAANHRYDAAAIRALASREPGREGEQP